MHASDAAGGGHLGHRSTGGLLGIDSIPNWSSYFYFPGVDQFGNPQFSWTYTMAGHSPFSDDRADDESGRTKIPAPVIPVIVDLRNADGSPRYVGGHRLIYSPADFVEPVLKSPVFDNYSYDSSAHPTQFTDAVQRAEFYDKAPGNWHTRLVPSVKTTRTMVLLQGTYRFALNPDGTCCAYILVDLNTFFAELFPSTPTDTTTVIGQAENAGEMTTSDIATLLFPNTYLYIPQSDGTIACCILGFHSYDLEPGGASNGWRERRYVMNYSSWITAGIFKGGLADVSALSHEMSETFNDPFGNNFTPWWLAPNGNCQDDLETGDVIENLPNGLYPIDLNGFTYHPQNEALLQWFAGQTPSSAIHGAYSYPDTTVLTSASVSQPLNCKASQ